MSMSFDPSAFLKEFDGAKREALVETMYLAADSDGEFSAVERDVLAQSIQGLAAGTEHEEALATDKLNGLLDGAQASLESDGRAARLESVKERLGDEDARKGALGLAISVTAADGIVRTSEREFIFDLAIALGLSGDVAADLVRDITRP